ncbi:MAG: HAD family hydrolase [Haloarculaceae archaeon]
MTYEAVVFDMDGVLLSGYHTPREVYRRATREVLAEFGVEDPPESLYEHDSAETWQRTCESIGVPAEDVWRARERRASELENERIAAGERQPFADADVMHDLDSTGIVSNNRRDTVNFVVDHFEFPTRVAYGRSPTLAGFERRKPNPHYLHRALDDLGVRPADALYVGDRASDVRTARNAGTDAALLARDGTPETREDPDYRIESLRDLESLISP